VLCRRHVREVPLRATRQPRRDGRAKANAAERPGDSQQMRQPGWREPVMVPQPESDRMDQDIVTAIFFGGPAFPSATLIREAATICEYQEHTRRLRGYC